VESEPGRLGQTMSVKEIKDWIEKEIEDNKGDLEVNASNSHVYSMAWSANETLKRLLEFIGELDGKE
jgi:hypothetical protein